MDSCIFFNYRNKINVSIHYSWLNSIIMAFLRFISLVLITIRYFVYLDDNTSLASYQLIYLTFYGFVITWIYFGCVVVHLIISKLILRNKSESKVGRFIEDCIDVMYEVALAIELTLTLLFWTLLAEGGQNLGSFDNLGIHLMPFLLLLMDFIFNSYQFPLRHFVFTAVIAGIYIIINQVHACSIQPVYDIYQCGNIWIPLVAFVLLAITHGTGHLTWKFVRGKKIQKQIQKTTQTSLLENS